MQITHNSLVKVSVSCRNVNTVTPLQHSPQNRDGGACKEPERKKKKKFATVGVATKRVGLISPLPDIQN